MADVRPSKRMSWSEPIIDRLRELGIDRHKIGISSLRGNLRAAEGTITLTQWEAINKAFPNATFEDVSVMMGQLRAVKSPEEVATLERATQITEAGVHAMIEAARPGVRDYEVHAALYYGMMKMGCEVPTMVIYGSGPFPTHDAFVPTHRVLQRGDMIANEIEGKYMGYSAQRVQPVVLGDAPAGYLEAMDKQRARIQRCTCPPQGRDHVRRGRPRGGRDSRVPELQGEPDDARSRAGGGPTDARRRRADARDRQLRPPGREYLHPEAQRSLADGPAANWGDTVVVTAQGGRRLGKRQA